MPLKLTASPKIDDEDLGRPTGATAVFADRDNHFNFLRLLLASLVLLSHSSEIIDGDRHREPLSQIFSTISFGEVAVAGFFLLSGFLIVQSWQRRPNLRVFLTHRALRIYPGFVVAVLASVFVAGALGASSGGRYLSQIQPRLLLSGLALLSTPLTPPTFPSQIDHCVNGCLWSISYEFVCYLCVALLGLCGAIRHRALFLAFTLLLAGLWLLPVTGQGLVLYSSTHLPLAITRWLLACWLWCDWNLQFIQLLAYFCVGGCFWLFRYQVRLSRGWALAGIAVLIPCMFSPTGASIALATVGAYGFFTLAFARLPFLAVFKGRTDISYGLYLYGWPVQKIILLYLPTVSPWTLFILSLMGATAAGWASWHWVEQPFLRLKERWAPANAAPLSCPLQPLLA